MRFIHTADWQIGKPFLRFGANAERLRTARLDAIEAIGRLAVTETVAHVLVAGDIFDSEAPANLTLRQPLERMRGFAGITWHLLPGNHDCHRPGGVWDRLRALGLPANVVPHLSPGAVVLDASTWLLTAPLTSRAEPRDLTAAMDRTATPEGAIRIGLAHGSVVNFQGEGDGEAGNPVDPARAERAGLAYLALGDWHRTQAINARTWYAGTPEPDRHRSQNVGQVLLVTAGSAADPPQVEPRMVGTHRWLSRSFEATDMAALADAETRLRAEAEPLSRLVLDLSLTGMASLAFRQQVGSWTERLQASLCHLDCDLEGLRLRPDASDLETIDFDGVLRKVSERLRLQVADPAAGDAERRIAEEALVILYLEAGAGTGTGEAA